MERHFDNELKELNKNILEMASLVEGSIIKSIEALKNQDINKAEEIINNDRNIDELELAIEDKCLSLLSLFQPQASDLRFITNAIKINAELERMADLSVDIAQRVLELGNQPLLKPLVDIPRLAIVAQKMVKEAIDSFVNRDIELAKKVIISDQEADNLRNLVQKELIYDYMAKDGTTSPRAVPLLLIARHLERICDHATNIAEDVIYMVSGEIVRHHPEKL
ncbi:MAG: phosphate signaling complex protein PhoU [Candidatus Omnitrophica bacterium]|nr:phosphate signaling complex protein PhoU [Candidatus Omnitrophota bacterium]MCM8823504.1 phosphate signaling complex protein PhoU [Candidatus Omnitrophota bacterium]MCM8826650.1 phosphate signaling complex protein PhoU [Candidatus Omnitrophota bacterium]